MLRMYEAVYVYTTISSLRNQLVLLLCMIQTPFPKFDATVIPKLALPRCPKLAKSFVVNLTPPIVYRLLLKYTENV